MNPTDPREEKDFYELLAEGINERAKERAELESTNSKLADEIAKLKGEVEALKSDLHTAQTEATGYWRQVEEWKEAHRGLMLSALRGLGESEDLLPAANQALIESQGASLRTKLATLRAELEAARSEDGGLVDEFLHRLLDELTRLGIDASDCDGDDPPEVILAGWIAGRIEDAEAERDTALAAKDAAEKRVADVVRERELWIHELRFAANRGCLYERLETLLAPSTALTPAPTQEPPAGGVTISTEKKGGDEPCAPPNQHVEGASLPANAKPQSSEDAQSTGASNSPADVPSEGRGEWMPFNLSDALAGKPVVTRKGKPITKIKEHGHSIFGEMDGVKHAWHKDGVYSRACESGWDLFMLPTEGSGA